MSNISDTVTQRVMPAPTTRVQVSGGDELDVWVLGEGTPVVFVHGGMMRDLLVPLADELTKRGDCQVIHFGRRGHGGRGLPAESTDIPGQAADVVAILDALGIETAHVAGHSFGAYIALELASRTPDRLLSALLLELLLAAHVQTQESQQAMKGFGEVVFPAIAEMYANGDRYGAVGMFCEATSGIEGARSIVESALPEGAGELAAADLATFLRVDGPAMDAWMPTVDPAVIQEITTPITWIGGADSPRLFTESRDIVRQWLPTTTSAEIAGAGHYFPLLKPAETATAVTEWLRQQKPGA